MPHLKKRVSCKELTVDVVSTILLHGKQINLMDVKPMDLNRLKCHL